MAISIYNIIKRPRITSKAYRLNQQLNQLVLEVSVCANKPLIAEALKKLFNVEAKKIRTIVSEGKVRRVGRRVIQGKTTKKAIVTLKEGYSVDLAGWKNRPEVLHEQSVQQ
jgi:large subunit ribosomal protein L23